MRDFLNNDISHRLRLELWRFLAVVDVQLKISYSLSSPNFFITTVLKVWYSICWVAETPCWRLVASVAVHAENALRVYGTYSVHMPNFAAIETAIRTVKP